MSVTMILSQPISGIRQLKNGSPVQVGHQDMDGKSYVWLCVPAGGELLPMLSKAGRAAVVIH